MAPEVILNKTRPTPYWNAIDVWSIGITAIELAQKDPPLSQMNPMRALVQIPLRSSPKLLEPEKWSSEFSDFLSLCLEKDPKKRATIEMLLKHPFLTKPATRDVMIPLIQKVAIERKRISEEQSSKEAEEDDLNTGDEDLDTPGICTEDIITEDGREVEDSETGEGDVITKEQSNPAVVPESPPSSPRNNTKSKNLQSIPSSTDLSPQVTKSQPPPPPSLEPPSLLTKKKKFAKATVTDSKNTSGSTPRATPAQPPASSPSPPPSSFNPLVINQGKRRKSVLVTDVYAEGGVLPSSQSTSVPSSQTSTPTNPKTGPPPPPPPPPPPLPPLFSPKKKPRKNLVGDRRSGKFLGLQTEQEEGGNGQSPRGGGGGGEGTMVRGKSYVGGSGGGSVRGLPSPSRTPSRPGGDYKASIGGITPSQSRRPLSRQASTRPLVASQKTEQQKALMDAKVCNEKIVKKQLQLIKIQSKKDQQERDKSKAKETEKQSNLARKQAGQLIRLKANAQKNQRAAKQHEAELQALERTKAEALRNIQKQVDERIKSVVEQYKEYNKELISEFKKENGEWKGKEETDVNENESSKKDKQTGKKPKKSIEDERKRELQDWEERRLFRWQMEIRLHSLRGEYEARWSGTNLIFQETLSGMKDRHDMDKAFFSSQHQGTIQYLKEQFSVEQENLKQFQELDVQKMERQHELDFNQLKEHQRVERAQQRELLTYDNETELKEFNKKKQIEEKMLKKSQKQWTLDNKNLGRTKIKAHLHQERVEWEEKQNQMLEELKAKNKAQAREETALLLSSHESQLTLLLSSQAESMQVLCQNHAQALETNEKDHQNLLDTQTGEYWKGYLALVRKHDQEIQQFYEKFTIETEFILLDQHTNSVISLVHAFKTELKELLSGQMLPESSVEEIKASVSLYLDNFLDENNRMSAIFGQVQTEKFQQLMGESKQRELDIIEAAPNNILQLEKELLANKQISEAQTKSEITNSSNSGSTEKSKSLHRRSQKPMPPHSKSGSSTKKKDAGHEVSSKDEQLSQELANSFTKCLSRSYSVLSNQRNGQILVPGSTTPTLKKYHSSDFFLDLLTVIENPPQEKEFEIFKNIPIEELGDFKKLVLDRWKVEHPGCALPGVH
eukprot:TRINITY_DN12111_c0_g1_i5.p1 TRINITY_DN12111_c0_g1~~TRINITY_DN12111_c0_g1_i5.p1  ORF type:complete len:1164 (-),score=355.10 TRINITY_DN12111_c0_g1_i5:39-3413(-)